MFLTNKYITDTRMLYYIIRKPLKIYTTIRVYLTKPMLTFKYCNVIDFNLFIQ